MNMKKVKVKKKLKKEIMLKSHTTMLELLLDLDSPPRKLLWLLLVRSLVSWPLLVLPFTFDDDHIYNGGITTHPKVVGLP